MISQLNLTNVKAGCLVGNSLVNHILFADDLCCMVPSLDGLQSLVNVCSEYAVANDIVFNCNKSFGVLFTPRKLQFSRQPKLVLNNKLIKFVHSVKYLGVNLCSTLSDDEDIRRQVRSLYCHANMLKNRFLKCSRIVKNSLFCSYCTSFYSDQL